MYIFFTTLSATVECSSSLLDGAAEGHGVIDQKISHTLKYIANKLIRVCLYCLTETFIRKNYFKFERKMEK